MDVVVLKEQRRRQPSRDALSEVRQRRIAETAVCVRMHLRNLIRPGTRKIVVKRGDVLALCLCARNE